MSHILTEDVQQLISQLITHITGVNDTSKRFKALEIFSYSHVEKATYYSPPTRKAIEETITKLCQKFRFHGCVNQAKYLEALTKKLFESTCEETLETRIFILKLFLELSESPTKYFLENPETFEERFIAEKPKSEDIDWAEYLNDTRIKTRDKYDSSSDEFSDDTESSETTLHFSKDIITENIDDTNTDTVVPDNTKYFRKPNITREAKIAKEKLVKTIQTQWWNKTRITETPFSKNKHALLTFNWEKHIISETRGLLNPCTNIISEYKIIRELLWQFFEPVSSLVFNFENGQISIKPNISVSSVIPSTFRTFLNEFMPYIQMLHTFRQFKNSLLDDYFVVLIPETYRCYSCGLEEILKPTFDGLVNLEDRVRKQEDIITLLTLQQELRPLFKDIKTLYDIHTELMKGYVEDDAFKSATDLMSRLYYGLLNSSNKTELDMYLTLYLHCLYKYINTIEIWLTQDVIADPTDEFVIIDKNLQGEEKWKLNYIVRQLKEFSNEDSMLELIADKILPLGTNFHLLHLLGKLHLVVREEDECTEFLHLHFVRKVLEEIKKFSNSVTTEPISVKESNLVPVKTNTDVPIIEPIKKLVTVCPEVKVSENNSDSLDNFLDFSDDFLTTIFQPFLYQKDDRPEDEEKSLYERVCESTANLFPVKSILEDTFCRILEKRFSVPGLLVKNILINDFALKKYLNLLRNVYLFENDMLFPLHKKMFIQFQSGQMWGNFYCLTSQLQDLLMDQYADFYQDCRVDVDPTWKICTDPIRAFDLVKIHCKINWPINIIIQDTQMNKYHETFQFILQLKWAMHTLHMLSFIDVEPKENPIAKQPPLIRERIRKLELMRFWLLNIVTSIHHYVLGHLYSILYTKFDKDFEECTDFESLRIAHDKFVSKMHIFCKRLREEMKDTSGFLKILSLVNALSYMWNNIKEIDDEILESCDGEYKDCYKFLRPIIELDVASIN